MSDLDKKLEPIRLKINAIDEQIINLLNQRGKLSLEVAHIKHAADPSMQNIRNRDRELDILKRVIQHNRGPFSDTQLTTIYELIIEEHRKLQHEVKKND